jgi:hypothetical protein
MYVKSASWKSIWSRQSWKRFHFSKNYYGHKAFDLQLNVPHVQGDQMSLWKNRPQCSPTHVLLKLLHNVCRGKRNPKNLGYFCNFQNIKNRPIRVYVMITIFCDFCQFSAKKLALFWVKDANFFAIFFGENIFKIITSVPGYPDRRAHK